jgi:hypothetical protein
MQDEVLGGEDDMMEDEGGLYDNSATRFAPDDSDDEQGHVQPRTGVTTVASSTENIPMALANEEALSFADPPREPSPSPSPPSAPGAVVVETLAPPPPAPVPVLEPPVATPPPAASSLLLTDGPASSAHNNEDDGYLLTDTSTLVPTPKPAPPAMPPLVLAPVATPPAAAKPTKPAAPAPNYTRRRVSFAVASADVGQRVVVKDFGPGVLRFYGMHAKDGKPRCGVELDEPKGLNNGTAGVSCVGA